MFNIAFEVLRATILLGLVVLILLAVYDAENRPKNFMASDSDVAVVNAGYAQMKWVIGGISAVCFICSAWIAAARSRNERHDD